MTASGFWGIGNVPPNCSVNKQGLLHLLGFLIAHLVWKH